jgi:hypothetical protein
MPLKQGLISSDIKGKVVIKLCKKTWNLEKAPTTKYLSVFF